MARIPVALAASLTAAAASFAAACASRPAEPQLMVTDNLQLYGLYDNERDWGPSFLVGPPDHHYGDQQRIDDNRALSPPAAEAAAPQAPDSPGPLVGAKPLPPLP